MEPLIGSGRQGYKYCVCPIKINSNIIELTIHTSCCFTQTYAILRVPPRKLSWLKRALYKSPTKIYDNIDGVKVLNCQWLSSNLIKFDLFFIESFLIPEIECKLVLFIIDFIVAFILVISLSIVSSRRCIKILIFGEKNLKDNVFCALKWFWPTSKEVLFKFQNK